MNFSIAYSGGNTLVKIKENMEQYGKQERPPRFLVRSDHKTAITNVISPDLMYNKKAVMTHSECLMKSNNFS